MTYLLVLLLGAIAVAALVIASRMRRKKRRSRLLDTPLPAGHRQVLDRNLPLYRRMPAELRDRLHGITNVLLDEKRFIGCGGLEVTDEMRVTIAGHASLLLLNRPGDFYPGFTSILVYPDTYFADEITYEFALLTEAVETGTDSVLDDYAVTSPAEFFAVATEVFFESARRMRDELPDLYGQLQRYYAIDPASWHE
ncbi:MAG: zinc-dependent peptidase [Woeseiaceae bacterium]|nr:zinc-dependent peptidase [Woeseiaceae bacterium]